MAACGGGGGSAEELCRELADPTRFEQVFEGFDLRDTERAATQLATARVELERLHEAAPGELEDELDVLLEAIDAIREAVETIDPADTDSVDEALRDVDELRSQIDAANAELETFRQTRCAGGG